MRVYTVVGTQKGYIEDVVVFINEEDADKFKTKIDEEYGNKDGNDSGLFRCDAVVTGRYRQLRWETIKILHSHGYSYRDMEVIFGCNKFRIREIELKGITNPNAHNFPARYLRSMKKE